MRPSQQDKIKVPYNRLSTPKVPPSAPPFEDRQSRRSSAKRKSLKAIKEKNKFACLYILIVLFLVGLAMIVVLAKIQQNERKKENFFNSLNWETSLSQSTKFTSYNYSTTKIVANSTLTFKEAVINNESSSGK